jgi:hypothetical protein
VEYPVETFSAGERARLEPHVTNLDEPVFALVNLPETVKGALFARYSRHPGTLRRMFHDEFAPSLPAGAVDPGDLDLLRVTDDVDEAVAIISAYARANAIDA